MNKLYHIVWEDAKTGELGNSYIPGANQPVFDPDTIEEFVKHFERNVVSERENPVRILSVRIEHEIYRYSRPKTNISSDNQQT